MTPVTMKFRVAGKGLVEISVEAGDGLRYIGATERAKCPHFSANVTFDRSKTPLEPGQRARATHVLVGPPPQGCSDEDLLSAGIGTCVSAVMVSNVAPSGQWEHVPAAQMADLVDAAEVARDERIEAAAAK